MYVYQALSQSCIGILQLFMSPNIATAINLVSQLAISPHICSQSRRPSIWQQQLQTPLVPSFRTHLFLFLLGHRGQKEDAYGQGNSGKGCLQEAAHSGARKWTTFDPGFKAQERNYFLCLAREGK